MTHARIGTSNEPRPHAYDPVTQPELFQGVLARRFVAFLIDATLILIPLAAVFVFMMIFTVATLGFGAVVFGLLGPVAAIWSILYVGITLGSERSATYGMRAMGLQMRTWYGAPMYFLLGAVHAIFFWALSAALTPFIVLVALFNSRRRTLHDFLAGTVVINDDERAASLRR
ncbi:MAG TPA: RDD family protein [Xanthobacteraceae bacterium]|nr:RDD family protein [Xanthobacteraceae bacterium]